MDPELMMDVVTLGLVYGVHVTEEAIQVRLTLTTRGCPLGDTIRSMAEQALSGISGNRRVEIEIVWDPAWDPMMIEETVRRQMIGN
jgi:metal-sulfur cluster biosynthetic enzyme